MPRCLALLGPDSLPLHHCGTAELGVQRTSLRTTLPVAQRRFMPSKGT